MKNQKVSRFFNALRAFNEAASAQHVASYPSRALETLDKLGFDLDVLRQYPHTQTHSDSLWFNALCLQLMHYNESLMEFVPLHQRLEKLLGILVQSLGLESVVVVHVAKACSTRAWFYKSGERVKQVPVVTHDAWPTEHLGSAPDERLTFALGQESHMMLHLKYKAKQGPSLPPARRDALQALWVPVMNEAFYAAQLQQQLHNNQVLYQVARMANTMTDKDELLNEYLNFISPLLGATEVAVMLPNPKTRAPEWCWVRFNPSGEVVTRQAMGEMQPVPDEVLSILNRRVFYSPAVREFDAHSSVFLALNPHTQAQGDHDKTRFTVAPFHFSAPHVPDELIEPNLADADETRAPLALIFRHQHSWTLEQQRILAEANEWLSHALDRALKLEEVLRHANFDALTGLMNRRAFYSRFCMEAERAVRNGLPLCIAVLDIDYFKAFNDNHGHLIGDAVLQQLSQYLSQHIRRADVLCRYGGEEFVILLPETTGVEAWELVDRLREGVAKQLKVPAMGQGQQWLPVTFSAGVSEVGLPRENAMAALALEDAEWRVILEASVANADKALYEAKSNGRNQVRCIS